jgi:hypothetical protein
MDSRFFGKTPSVSDTPTFSVVRKAFRHGDPRGHYLRPSVGPLKASCRSSRLWLRSSNAASRSPSTFLGSAWEVIWSWSRSHTPPTRGWHGTTAYRCIRKAWSSRRVRPRLLGRAGRQDCDSRDQGRTAPGAGKARQRAAGARGAACRPRPGGPDQRGRRPGRRGARPSKPRAVGSGGRFAIARTRRPDRCGVRGPGPLRLSAQRPAGRPEAAHQSAHGFAFRRREILLRRACREASRVVVPYWSAPCAGRSPSI